MPEKYISVAELHAMRKEAADALNNLSHEAPEIALAIRAYIVAVEEACMVLTQELRRRGQNAV